LELIANKSFEADGYAAAQFQRWEKWLGLIEQLFPKDKWIGSRMSVLGKAHES